MTVVFAFLLVSFALLYAFVAVRAWTTALAIGLAYGAMYLSAALLIGV